MKISGQRDYLVNLESVAMTDIVLNMFIFFFISFSLLYTFNPQRIQKLEIKLPESTHATPMKNINQVTISVTSEGPMYLDNQLVTRKELKEKVNILSRKNPDLSVNLHSDKLVRFKYIVDVLDILSESGVKSLNIAVTSEQP